MKIKAFLLCSLFLTVWAAAVCLLPAEITSQPLPQDPAVLSGKLDNGLSYYIMHNPKPEQIAELRLYIDAGSVDEDDDQRGLAHFTEHMVFNGTKNFGKSEIVNYLSSIGMGFENGLNGGTTYDLTYYMFKVPSDEQDKLRKGLQILSDMAWQVSFDPSEIERERGVVIEEWRMGLDADSRVRDVQNAVFLAGSRYAERSPIGTYEVLSTFLPETLKRYYQDWYRPDLQSVVIVGDFDPQAMLGLVKEFFGPIPARVNPRPRLDFSIPESLAPKAVVALDKEYPRNSLQVLWKKDHQNLQTVGESYDKLKRDLFYSLLNTRLKEHSKDDDPPYSYAASFEFPLLRTMSAAVVFSSFTAGKSEQALQTILTEVERVQRYGFLPSEFARAKSEVLRYAELEVEQKDTRESDYISWGLIDCISNHNTFTDPEQNLQLLSLLIEEVSLDEVNALISGLIADQNMCISIGAPEIKGLEYPTTERLLEIAQSISAQEITAYEDKTLDEPLMDWKPQPVALKKQKFDAKTGIRTWVLANGVTVHAKKTDFRNDEVLLSAVSPGGFALYGEEDVPAAEILSDYLQDTGVGNFDGMALDKALTGKVVSASLQVDLNSEGCFASCSPKDMELMFQLLFQYATNPRFNEEDFQSFIQRQKAFYTNRNLEPSNVFFDKMFSTLYGNNPYFVSLAEVDLDGIKLDTIKKIYRDRFADFSDFTFVVVGNFDESMLKTYCQTYLGNLPTLKRKDKPRDVGIRAVQDKHEVRLRMGSSERSFVAHFTNGAYKPSTQQGVMLDALENVLNEKLRENIREELSGVYYIQSMTNITNYPKPHYILGTIMACSPARVDELNQAIFATLDSIAVSPVDERYIVSAKATLEQKFSENIKSNHFWLGQIRNNAWLKRPLTEFLSEPKYFSQINSSSMQQTARKYLQFDKNKLSLIMLPESPLTP